MKNQILLPAKYYHTHFQELLSHIKETYQYCFLDAHHQFLKDFEALSEDAQCLYVRMLNRKGSTFPWKDFDYQEILNREEALQELMARNFSRFADEKDSEQLVKLIPKPQLMELLSGHRIPFKKSAAVAVLRDLVHHSLSLPQELLKSFIVQEKIPEMEYLLFLFFGKMQDNLNLYTLRDLGIRKSNSQKGDFKARFENQQEALVHFRFAKLWKSYHAGEVLPAVDEWPRPLCLSSLDYKNSLLLGLGEDSRKAAQFETALGHWKNCEIVPAREKSARLLYQLDRKAECRGLLDEMLREPWSDEECLFAEDFFARKFEQKKISLLTETLRSARKIAIDESYYRHPELGVIDLLKQEGMQAYHTENGIWNVLFGLTFWHELFENQLMHNQFERLPLDLKQGKFFERHAHEIEGKLEKLADVEIRSKYFTDIIQQKEDEVNGVFGWYPELGAELEILLLVPWDSLSQILLKMSQNYRERSTGFPDLMVVKDQRVFFYEVKATGDSLRQNQLKQIMLLKKAGIEVELMQVEYQLSEDQTYVVVDIETTGIGSSFHRITEIGAVKIKGGKIIDTFQTLVNPGKPIPRNIQQLTGITNEMVKDAPKFEEIADSLQAFTADAIFAAHNVNFDYTFIQNEFAKIEQRFVRPHICTKAGMKKYYPGNASYGLKNLSELYSIPLKNHHRALSDAEAAAGLLLLINRKRKESAQT